MSRFEAFETEVRRRKDLDLAVQLGDFCYPDGDSTPLTTPWRGLPVSQLNVLVNHDMERGTKAEIMGQWATPDPKTKLSEPGWRLMPPPQTRGGGRASFRW